MQKSQPEVIWRKATGTHDAMPTMADLNSFAPSSPSAAMSMAGMDSSYFGSGFWRRDGFELVAMHLALLQPSRPGSTIANMICRGYFGPVQSRASAPTLGADSSPQAKTMLDKGADFYEIPAFLRKQAD